MNSCFAYDVNGKREFIETVQTEWEAKWDLKIMYYDVIASCQSVSDKDLKKALNLAMSTWESEIDIQFHPAWVNHDKVNLTIDFKTSEQDLMFKEKPGVLAYSYFPGQGSVSGKVVFNNDYIWSLNGKGIKPKDAIAKGYPVKGTPNPDSELKTYNIITVLIHELGHSLGLRHDEHGDTDDMMDAYYNGKIELSNWDIFRIRLKYPERVIEASRYKRLKQAILNIIKRQ